MSLLGELKRRNVFRVAGVYAVVGWLLVQVSASLEEAVGLPEWFDGLVVSLLAIGFPIALIFAWAFELTSDGIKRTSTVDADDSITTKTGSKLDIVLVLALILFAGAMLAPGLLNPDRLPGLASDAVAEASIAVLPFADLSPAGDQEYFADGISEELLNVLAKVSGMKVAGRTSSFAFKGRNEDLREIGRVLDVAHILEGSVRSQGDKVRVTAQLIQVSDGFHLWSETYDGDLNDIFAVQDDIAAEILIAMKAQLNVEEAQQLAPVQRTDVTAYGLFLEARDLIFTRDPKNMERALELLNKAIEIDPAYAPAYASRAKVLTLLSDRPGSYGTLPSGETLLRARSDVEKALELDAELSDAYAVQGLINSDTGRSDFAITSLRRAIELNPNSLDARNWLALALANDGRLRDVAAQLKALTDIDPLYRPGVNNAILYSLDIGDRDTARSIGERYIANTQDVTEKTLTEAELLARLDGKIGESIALRETVPELSINSLDNANLRGSYGDLGILDEYKGSAKTLPVFEPWMRLQRRDVQGAIDLAEAAIEKAPDFMVGHSVYIGVLFETAEDQRLVDYFEAEYRGSLEEYATRLRPGVNADPPPYLELAVALRNTGNQAMHEEAMRRMRFAIDIFRAGGDVSSARDLSEARYWAIWGDREKALQLLEQAFNKRTILDVFEFTSRAYESLRDEARFWQLREANLKRVNEEREILGYAPLTLAFYSGFDLTLKVLPPAA
ncbi:adenylyl cyclase [Congregibacter variabilis]|uniref:Adenylyl cyclase n=1 Tax=Congregibacter variabilis TaxID=3081200 RepID=A0ABZ0I0B3_9GAMM|nr:adenylyl cyclase [Congregibacter sp. IMCC43200]